MYTPLRLRFAPKGGYLRGSGQSLDMLGCPQSHCEMVEEGAQEEKKGEEWKGGWWAGSGSPHTADFQGGT